ncbi:DUF2163 domain-containing protein [Maricaulis sp. CAU 1757]
MLELSEGLRAALARGVTTLCACWRVTRRDGAVYGFTEHDRELVIDGLAYRPGSGFGGAEMSLAEGMAPGQGEVAGALDADVLTVEDLEAGLWSGAAVEVWRVDWQDVAARVRTGRFVLGEVRRVDGRFEADLLGPAHRLDAMTGRVYGRRCDAKLGEARCGVAQSHPAFGLGCDQAFATCRDRFANTLNFRGFPYLPGNDALMASPQADQVKDGGSRGLA